MAVIQPTGGGSSILGNIGDLAALAGMAIPGAQFLTPLGMSMKAVDRMMGNGGGGSMSDDADMVNKLKDILGGWTKPTDNNIASANQGMTSWDELVSRGWRI